MQKRKIRASAPVHHHIAKRLNPILNNVHSRGHAVDSETVIAKRLPDGRIQLFLHPSVRALFESR